jgi:hypothetical protein
MKLSYGFNPNNEYGSDIAPSMENYNTSLSKHEGYPRKVISQDFGFMDLFSLVMIIPFWIFVYKFFYLLVLPLIPVSVVVFELVREVVPLNKLFMFGGSFLAAYLFYRILKYFFFSLSFGWRIFYLLGVYALSVLILYLVLGIYPDNEVLNNSLIDLKNLWINFLEIVS